MNYIDIIKKGRQLNSEKEIYYLSNGQNEYLVKLLKKNENEYSNIIQYKTTKSIMSTLCDVKEFCEKYLIPKMSIQILKKRFYGEPKLSKPKELKNIKQEFSVEFIKNKCKFSCFKKDNDLYVLCRDYFSKPMEIKLEDYGAPLSFLCEKYLGKDKINKKFIYDDCFGSIVLRNECWFKINNIYLMARIKKPLELKNMLIKQWCKIHGINEIDLDFNWENTFEQIIEKI